MRPPAVARAAVLASLLGTAAATPPAASAAEVRVNRSCFADPKDRPDTVKLSGTGFTPNAPYKVTLDGEGLTGGSGHVDAAGNVSGTFVAPGVALASHDARQHTFRLGVEEGDNAPETAFTVSRLYASFRPSTGVLRTLRVRFSVYGFGLQGAARPPVYLHYVRPDGRLERTVRLGTATGACGSLRSAERRLFAGGARRGDWRLQFDTRRGYTRGTARSAFLFYAVPVQVR